MRLLHNEKSRSTGLSRTITGALVAVAMTACGGGGGGSTDTTATTDNPLVGSWRSALCTPVGSDGQRYAFTFNADGSYADQTLIYFGDTTCSGTAHVKTSQGSYSVTGTTTTSSGSSATSLSVTYDSGSYDGAVLTSGFPLTFNTFVAIDTSDPTRLYAPDGNTSDPNDLDFTHYLTRLAASPTGQSFGDKLVGSWKATCIANGPDSWSPTLTFNADGTYSDELLIHFAQTDCSGPVTSTLTRQGSYSVGSAFTTSDGVYTANTLSITYTSALSNGSPLSGYPKTDSTFLAIDPGNVNTMYGPNVASSDPNDLDFTGVYQRQP